MLLVHLGRPNNAINHTAYRLGRRAQGVPLSARARAASRARASALLDGHDNRAGKLGAVRLVKGVCKLQNQRVLALHARAEEKGDGGLWLGGETCRTLGCCFQAVLTCTPGAWGCGGVCASVGGRGGAWGRGRVHVLGTRVDRTDVVLLTYGYTRHVHTEARLRVRTTCCCCCCVPGAGPGLVLRLRRYTQQPATHRCQLEIGAGLALAVVLVGIVERDGLALGGGGHVHQHVEVAGAGGRALSCAARTHTSDAGDRQAASRA